MKTGRVERGLEFSELAIIDVYLQHLTRDKPYLPISVRHLVLDGYIRASKSH